MSQRGEGGGVSQALSRDAEAKIKQDNNVDENLYQSCKSSFYTANNIVDLDEVSTVKFEEPGGFLASVSYTIVDYKHPLVFVVFFPH